MNILKIKNNILNFIKYKDLLFEMTKNNIKLKYTHSFLGILWSMLDPLLTMLVLTFIFSNLFARSVQNFPVYIMCGKIIFGFFSDTTSNSIKVIQNNISLVKKIYVPKYLFPLSKTLASFISLFISFIPLAVVMLITGVKTTPHVIGAIFPLTYLFFISFGIGLILATISVFFGDMQHLYSVFLLLLMYLSAIFYPVSTLPKAYLPIFQLNPVFTVIDTFRNCVMYGVGVTITQHIRMFVYALVYMIAGLFIFYKKQDKFILYI